MNIQTSILGLALALPLFINSCDENTASSTPETLFQGEYSDSEMDVAMKNARMTLPIFSKALSNKSCENHAVKVAIKDGEDVEHFWLVDIEPSDGGYTGTLNNEPGLVSNVAIGDQIDAIGEDISDWMYFKEGMMHGNYTLRVLLPNMSEEEAVMYRPILAPLP